MNILRVKVRHANAPGADIDGIMLASTAARQYPPLAAIVTNPKFTCLEYTVDLVGFSISLWDHDQPLSTYEALRLAIDTLDMLGDGGVEPWPAWAKNSSWLRRVLGEAADRAAEREMRKGETTALADLLPIVKAVQTSVSYETGHPPGKEWGMHVGDVFMCELNKAINRAEDWLQVERG